MTTSKELRKRLAQIKRDAAAAVCDFLGDRESINIDIWVDGDTRCYRLYREMTSVFADAVEPEMYDPYTFVKQKYWIERFSLHQLIKLLEGLEESA